MRVGRDHGGEDVGTHAETTRLPERPLSPFAPRKDVFIYSRMLPQNILSRRARDFLSGLLNLVDELSRLSFATRWDHYGRRAESVRN